jgi:hypothetical protein
VAARAERLLAHVTVMGAKAAVDRDGAALVGVA